MKDNGKKTKCVRITFNLTSVLDQKAYNALINYKNSHEFNNMSSALKDLIYTETLRSLSDDESKIVKTKASSVSQIQTAKDKDTEIQAVKNKSNAAQVAEDENHAENTKVEKKEQKNEEEFDFADVNVAATLLD